MIKKLTKVIFNNIFSIGTGVLSQYNKNNIPKDPKL